MKKRAVTPSRPLFCRICGRLVSRLFNEDARLVGVHALCLASARSGKDGARERIAREVAAELEEKKALRALSWTELDGKLNEVIDEDVA